jgi:pre-mRNA-processing factor SLU7
MSDPSSSSSLPDYVRKQPWYYSTGDDTVSHQRIAPFAEQPQTSLSDHSHRAPQPTQVVKWKPGSCKNCGSTTHTEKDCTERPRRANARSTGDGVASTAPVEQHDLSYDAKHDSYSNYDGSRWWQDVRGQFRFAEQVRASSKGSEAAPPVAIQEEYGHSGFRNRQDLAPYLANLGTHQPVSVHDDHMWMKSDTPAPALLPTAGGAVEQQHAREFYESAQMAALSGARGDAFVPEEVPRSRYGDAEDRFEFGHTSVFGSYFCDGQWGYKCCRQMVRDCRCTAGAQ